MGPPSASPPTALPPPPLPRLTGGSGPAAYGDDELYFGSVPVYLAQVPGTAIPYLHPEWMALREPAAL
jgi:hypothetical protein